MREILFRGKRVDNGEPKEWVEGYLFRYGIDAYDEETYILGKLDHRESVYDIWKCAEKVIPETVGQFTGLLDKNGKKIFEGDIIDLPHWYVAYAGDLRESTGMHAGWYVQRDGFESWTELECTEDNEVIGNIHDNPELLTS